MSRKTFGRTVSFTLPVVALETVEAMVVLSAGVPTRRSDWP